MVKNVRKEGGGRGSDRNMKEEKTTLCERKASNWTNKEMKRVF